MAQTTKFDSVESALETFFYVDQIKTSKEMVNATQWILKHVESGAIEIVADNSIAHVSCENEGHYGYICGLSDCPYCFGGK